MSDRDEIERLNAEVARLRTTLGRTNHAAIRASIAMEEHDYSDPGAFESLRRVLIDPKEFEGGGRYELMS